MKKPEKNQANFVGLTHDELTHITGGSFAYDLGRFIRACGIYLTEGTGIPGTAAALTDLAVNSYLNG